MELDHKRYRAQFSLRGAELLSFYDKDLAMEYIHDGNPKFWGGRNPTLFPKVGRSYMDIQRIHGIEYHMGNHGFLRSANFRLVHQDETSISFLCCSDEETRKQYPFEFEFLKTYTVVGGHITITHEVTNKGEQMMPFSIGHHPAFRCPLVEGEEVGSYRITFDQPETLSVLMGNAETDMLANHVLLEEEKQDQIALPYSKYGMDSLVFDGLRSSYVTLQGPLHGVRVCVIGFPIVTLWPKQSTPFLCIEPWLSMGDPAHFVGEFQDKQGMIYLKKDRLFVNTYEFEVF